MHVKENVLFVAIPFTVCEPDVGFGPDHAPTAVHASAPAVDHVNVDVPPAVTVAGLAVKDSVGAVGGAAARTSTVTDLATVMPPPEQINANVLKRTTLTDCEPATSRGPDQSPEASHESA